MTNKISYPIYSSIRLEPLPNNNSMEEYRSLLVRTHHFDRFPPSPASQRRQTKRLRDKFLFIDIRDKELNQLLGDLRSRFSNKKKPSTNIHITINGPKVYFKKKSLQERIKKYKSDHPYITIGGVGTFLNDGVHVIYIKADCGDLKKYDLWEKPDYKDSYNPHITIYEGRDEKVALKVRNELASLNVEHKCRDYDFSVHTLNQFDLNN